MTGFYPDSKPISLPRSQAGHGSYHNGATQSKRYNVLSQAKIKVGRLSFLTKEKPNNCDSKFLHRLQNFQWALHKIFGWKNVLSRLDMDAENTSVRFMRNRRVLCVSFEVFVRLVFTFVRVEVRSVKRRGTNHSRCTLLKTELYELTFLDFS